MAGLRRSRDWGRIIRLSFVGERAGQLLHNWHGSSEKARQQGGCSLQARPRENGHTCDDSDETASKALRHIQLDLADRNSNTFKKLAIWSHWNALIVCIHTSIINGNHQSQGHQLQPKKSTQSNIWKAENFLNQPCSYSHCSNSSRRRSLGWRHRQEAGYRRKTPSCENPTKGAAD